MLPVFCETKKTNSNLISPLFTLVPVARLSKQHDLQIRLVGGKPPKATSGLTADWTDWADRFQRRNFGRANRKQKDIGTGTKKF